MAVAEPRAVGGIPPGTLLRTGRNATAGVGPTAGSRAVSGEPTVVTCPVCGRKNRVPAIADGVPRCGNCGTRLPWTADADDATFVDVVNASVPVLVDLWAPWCGPCRMVSPALEHLAQELAGRIKLVKVNVDAAPGVSQRFSVQGIPTLVILDRDQLLARRSGAAPEPALRAWVEQVLADAPNKAGAAR